MGRVRRLAELRAERRDAIARAGTARMAFEAAPASGKLVVEAERIAKGYGGRVLVRDFSIRIGRGERVALVGPNGVGKTTLLNILTGALGAGQRAGAAGREPDARGLRPEPGGARPRRLALGDADRRRALAGATTR